MIPKMSLDEQITMRIFPKCTGISQGPSPTTLNTLSLSTPIHRHFNTNTLSCSTPMPARLQHKYRLFFNTSTHAHPEHQYLLILNTNTWSCSTITRSHVQHKYVCWKREQRCSEQRSICVLKSNPLSLCWTSVYRCSENRCQSVCRKVYIVVLNKCRSAFESVFWKKVFICVLKKCLSVFWRSVYQCSEKERIGVLKTCLSGFWKIVYRCSEKVSIGVNETCEKCENAKNAKMRKMRNM